MCDFFGTRKRFQLISYVCKAALTCWKDADCRIMLIFASATKDLIL